MLNFRASARCWCGSNLISESRRMNCLAKHESELAGLAHQNLPGSSNRSNPPMKLAQVSAPLPGGSSDRRSLAGVCCVLLAAMLLPAAGQAPFITVQPTNFYACPGMDAQFYVAAEGT